MAQLGNGSHRSLAGMNGVTVRESNRSAVFEAIRHYAPISRKALAAHSGLNPATVTHIVDDLLGAGLVLEVAGDTTVAHSNGATLRRAVGRRPTGLSINADACYLVGLDLTHTSATVVITNLAAELLVHKHFTVSLSHSADMHVNRVLKEVEHAIAHSGLPRDRIRGIGVGAPGPLNTRTGTVMSKTFESWANVPLKQLLEERFALPVTVDNDSNTAALAEQWFGAGRECANFAYVVVGAGVGAGMVVNGHLFQGGGDLSPEFGHTSILADGPMCGCGNRGCLEMLAATPHMVSRVVEAMRLGGTSILSALLPPNIQSDGSSPDPLHEDFDALTPERIWDAVEKGDPLATAVVSEICTHLATGLANLVALFHPSVIFIGHDMSRAGPRTYALLRIALAERGVPSQVQVLPATTDDWVPALGAVTLALRTLFAGTTC